MERRVRRVAGRAHAAPRAARHAAPRALLFSIALLGALTACSPEARRVRDGGDGADPGNKDIVDAPVANPRAADTTLWPGRAPAVVDRLARGEVPPPVGVSAAAAPGKTGDRPVTSAVPPTKSEQQTFDKGTSANPRRRTP